MAEMDPWNTRSDEEKALYPYFEADGDQETKRKNKESQDEKTKEAQTELKKAGMLPVAGCEWKGKLKETLIEACKDEETAKKLASDDTIFEEVEKASKATCLVVRGKNSDRVCGTGCLINPKHSTFGWLVITNNHVIMDEKEAKSAVVVFDHLDDKSLDQAQCFKVKRILSKSDRTKSADDYSSLDFSLLVLECGGKDKEDYLENRGLPFEVTNRITSFTNEPMLKMCGLKFTPIIAFSHPDGRCKHFSIGKFPDKWEGEAHIRHDLPTKPGSSGANLIVADLNHDPQKLFVRWAAAFVHYRHGLAVAWQAIASMIRKDFS